MQMQWNDHDKSQNAHRTYTFVAAEFILFLRPGSPLDSAFDGIARSQVTNVVEAETKKNMHNNNSYSFFH